MSAILELETNTRILQVTEIKMFHAKAVARWRGLIASAQEKLGGVQSGIGFIGSAGWVITGSLVLGAIEGALSSANAKLGMKILGEAGQLLEEMHKRGTFVPISEIENIDQPRPEMWQARRGTIDFILNGDDFLRVRTVDGAELNIRWSAIACAGMLNG